MTDERLLVDYVSHGDGSAFETMIRRHGPTVYRVCRDVLGDSESAEDAFQATFLVLVRRAGSIREGRALGRWLYEVALRIARRERRRLARIKAQERQVSEMEAAAPPDFDPADREMKPILHEEIGRLPAKLREALVLCYFQGLTVEEAARSLGCPLGTLKSRLGKGRELLRSRLTRRGLAASVLLLLLFSLTEEASARMPESLLDTTLRSGSHGFGGIGVSRQVASMVLQEEDWSRWLMRFAGSLGLFVVLLVVFGASRMALARKAEAATTTPLGTSSLIPGALPGMSSPMAPGSAPGEHCAP
jgi:polysaccharide biosynthesis/export protein